jgi:hypothetical protein
MNRSIFLTRPKVLKKTDNCRLELSGMRLTNAKNSGIESTG